MNSCLQYQIESFYKKMKKKNVLNSFDWTNLAWDKYGYLLCIGLIWNKLNSLEEENMGDCIKGHNITMRLFFMTFFFSPFY